MEIETGHRVTQANILGKFKISDKLYFKHHCGQIITQKTISKMVFSQSGGVVAPLIPALGRQRQVKLHTHA